MKRLHWSMSSLGLDDHRQLPRGGQTMAASNEQAERAKYGQVVAKAWSDSAFKAKLLKDPQAALVEAGVEVPAGVSVKVVVETETTRYFILPLPPPEGDLSEEALEKVAGGTQGAAPGQFINAGDDPILGPVLPDPPG